MKLKTLVSTLAIAAAATFGASPAFALTINGVEIPADQVSIIMQHCEALQANDQASTTDSNNAATTNNGNDNGSDANSSSESQQGETGAAGQNLAVDLDSVNLAVCKESGALGGTADAGAAAPAADTNAMAATDANATVAAGEMSDVMLMGKAVPKAELAIVTQHCEALRANEQASSNDSANQATTNNGNDNGSNADDASASIQGETGVAGQTLSIDLDTVGLADCKAAGLVQ